MMHKEILKHPKVWLVPFLSFLCLYFSSEAEAGTICTFTLPSRSLDVSADTTSLQLYAQPRHPRVQVRSSPEPESPAYFFAGGNLPVQRTLVLPDGSRWFQLNDGNSDVYIPTQDVTLVPGQPAAVVVDCRDEVDEVVEVSPEAAARQQVENSQARDLSNYPVVSWNAWFNGGYFGWHPLPGGQQNHQLYHLRFPEGMEQSVHIYAAHNYTAAGRMIIQLYRQGGVVQMNLRGQPEVFQVSAYGRFPNSSTEPLYPAEPPQEVRYLAKVTDPQDERFALYIVLTPVPTA